MFFYGGFGDPWVAASVDLGPDHSVDDGEIIGDLMGEPWGCSWYGEVQKTSSEKKYVRTPHKAWFVAGDKKTIKDTYWNPCRVCQMDFKGIVIDRLRFGLAPKKWRKNGTTTTTIWCLILVAGGRSSNRFMFVLVKTIMPAAKTKL